MSVLVGNLENLHIKSIKRKLQEKVLSGCHLGLVLWCSGGRPGVSQGTKSISRPLWAFSSFLVSCRNLRPLLESMSHLGTCSLTGLVEKPHLPPMQITR